MWEVLWGWVVHRASHSVEIRHVWIQSFRVKAWPHVSKKLPFYHWGQNPTHAPGSTSVARAGFNKSDTEGWQWGSVAGSQPLLLYVSIHFIAACLPKPFLVFSFTYWQEWAFILYAKKETVAIKILINEHTEQILLSVMPFQLHWTQGHLASFTRTLKPASPPEIQRVFGRLSARTKKVEVYVVGH